MPPIAIQFIPSLDFCRTPKNILMYLEFISRNGSIPFTDESGRDWLGIKGIKALCRAWNIKKSNPTRTYQQIYALTIYLRDPVHPKLLEEAGRRFFWKTFMRRYAFIFNIDSRREWSQHIHICVLSAPFFTAQERMKMPNQGQLLKWQKDFMAEVHSVINENLISLGDRMEQRRLG